MPPPPDLGMGACYSTGRAVDFKRGEQDKPGEGSLETLLPMVHLFALEMERGLELILNVECSPGICYWCCRACQLTVSARLLSNLR